MLHLVLAIAWSGLCGLFTIEGSREFKHNWYLTSRLCPDLQYFANGKDADSQNKSSFLIVKHWLSSELPCFLEGSDSSAQISKALIAGVFIDKGSWKFSNDATTCDKLIKIGVFKPSLSKKRSYSSSKICGVPGGSEFREEFNASDLSILRITTYNTVEWNFLNKNLIGYGWKLLKFMTPSLWKSFDDSKHVEINFPSLLDSDSIYLNDHPKEFWLKSDHNIDKHMQIIFIVQTAAGVCNVQIQQYIVKNKKESTSCQTIQQYYPFRLCGVYGCDKITEIIRAIGVWDKRTRQIPKKFTPEMIRGRKRYKGDDGRIIAFLTVPLLIYGGCYALLKLREKFVNRHSSSTEGSARERRLFRPPRYYWRSSVRGDVNNDSHITDTDSSPIDSSRPTRPSTTTTVCTNDVVIPPVNFAAEEEEPPPPFDCLDKLPTYEEATKT